MTDEEPNSLCQDFYTFLSGGSDFLGRLKFPQQATISNLCVDVCAELALCLANYVLALEPSPRPWPLPPSSQQTALHSTTLSECLSHYHSWLAHSKKKRKKKNPSRNILSFFPFLHFRGKQSIPVKFSPFPRPFWSRRGSHLFLVSSSILQPIITTLWSKVLTVVNMFQSCRWISTWGGDQFKIKWWCNWMWPLFPDGVPQRGSANQSNAR